ncbi:MAG: ABC transporter permease [Gammaproteobacteria bacterium]|nr:MAG: ABC transporter permease [Gammaproteobacteria bacterium]
MKELIQLRRDKALLLFFAYAFTLDIYFAGSGVSLQLHRAAFHIQDEDKSHLSRELMGRFLPPYFEARGSIASDREAFDLLDRGKTTIVFSIPPRFQEQILRGEDTQVQMLLDATHAPQAFLASSYAAQILGRFGLEQGLALHGMSAEALEHLPRVESRHRAWYNPNQNDAWFMTLSELLSIITVFSILLPAAAMVREKERGTVEQLLVSPLTPFHIMFPKVLAMTLVILTGTLVSLFAVMGPIFHLPMRGSLPLFFALTALYTFTNAGLGLFASTFSRNQAQVGMVSILLVAPMILLSGAWTPPEAMPEWLRAMMLFSPLFYFIEATFGILLKGAPLSLLWDDVAGMALLGGGIFAFGAWRFRRQFG